ncbi:bifunctional folylpolyglutamate synthase/dihydrofolate synthase, partial [Francisella tularensis subsp. holarctica]|nr:bifunctional folylpolyglutamate synthase/dihydrofolate synthase [Francisella tularensis subsp. holarctica]
DLEKIKKELKLQQIILLYYNKDLISFYLAKKDTLTVVFGSFVLSGEYIRHYEKYTSKR